VAHGADGTFVDGAVALCEASGALFVLASLEAHAVALWYHPSQGAVMAGQGVAFVVTTGTAGSVVAIVVLAIETVVAMGWCPTYLSTPRQSGIERCAIR
jgi:hypothetical protein